MEQHQDLNFEAKCLSDAQICYIILKIRRRNSSSSIALQEMSPSKVIRYLKLDNVKVTKGLMASIFEAQHQPLYVQRNENKIADITCIKSVNMLRDTDFFVPPPPCLDNNNNLRENDSIGFEKALKLGIIKKNKLSNQAQDLFIYKTFRDKLHPPKYMYLKATFYSYYKKNIKFFNRRSLKNKKMFHKLLQKAYNIYERVYRVMAYIDKNNNETELRLNSKRMSSYFNREITVEGKTTKGRPAIINNARKRAVLFPFKQVVKFTPGDVLLFDNFED
jgi:hypothetical protein